VTIQLDVADSPTLLNLAPMRWAHGVYTDEGVRDGHHGIRLDNGMWRSVQPNGSYQERPSPDGPYEWFDLDPTVNVVRVTPATVTYAIAVRER